MKSFRRGAASGADATQGPASESAVEASESAVPTVPPGPVDVPVVVPVVDRPLPTPPAPRVTWDALNDPDTTTYRYSGESAYAGARIGRLFAVADPAEPQRPAVGALTAGALAYAASAPAQVDAAAAREALDALDAAALGLIVVPSVPIWSALAAEMGLDLPPQSVAEPVATTATPVQEQGAAVQPVVADLADPVTEPAVADQAVHGVAVADPVTEPSVATSPQAPTVWEDPASVSLAQAEEDAYATLLADLRAYSDIDAPYPAAHPGESVSTAEQG